MGAVATAGALRRTRGNAGCRCPRGDRRGRRMRPAISRMAVRGVIAALCIFAIVPAVHQAGTPGDGRSSPTATVARPDDTAASEFGVSPQLPHKVRRMDDSSTDLNRTSRMAWVVVPLLLVLLAAH